MNPVEQKKILVIDDSEENRLILTELCKSLGYAPSESENGRSAKELLLTGYFPTVILCDINMPEMDGYAFLQFVKSDLKFREIPVLMVTSIEETDSVIKCLKLGAEDYLTKPIEPEILKARIQNSVKRLEALIIEKQLLEQTFAGSIKIFSDILSLLSPQIFGKSARIRRYAKAIAEELQYPEIWEIEVSAMFSLIGCISLPHDITDKIINGKPLVGEEKTLFEHHPIIGHKLLKNIPRLENVAINILNQNKNLENLGQHGTKQEDMVPTGAQILKAAFAYDSITGKIMDASDIIIELKKKTGLLSPHISAATEAMIQKDQSREAINETVATLKIGMVFAEDTFTVSGSKVAGKWQEVSQTFIERLTQIHSKMPVKEPIKVFLMNK